jgi:protease-4
MRKFRRILIVLLIVGLVLWALLPDRGPSVEPGSILVVELAGTYVEAAAPPLLTRLLGERRPTVASLLSDLRKAERDDRLSAVVLRIRNLEIGWGKAQEIRDAIADLRAAGRPTVAYLEVSSIGANLEYYVATAADEIRAAPGTAAPLVGLAAEYLFLGGLWEKIGAGIETEGIGEYKSAAETISGSEMSEPFREMANSLLDSINGQFVGGIAASRGLTPHRVGELIDAAPGSAAEMVDLGLIDGISFYDQVIEDLGGHPVIQGEDYARVDPSTVGFEPVSRFALVYGSGAVVMGRGARSPTGSLLLTSDTVSSALDEAARDDSIDAIIFRVDSPGGSPLASDIVWRAVERARERKPLIVSISDVAASGGYYLACGADSIVAPPGSLIGSIGVFVMRPFLGGLLENLGIGVETLTRGARAELLLASQPLSEKGRAHLRAEIEKVYELFVGRVAVGRDLAPARVRAVARGRVWTGVQAVENDLIDGLGGLRVAAQHAKEALGLDPDDDAVLVPYPAPQSFAEQIDEMLRRIAARATPQLPLPLPRPARRLAQWLAVVPEGSPALIPPFIVDIR